MATVSQAGTTQGVRGGGVHSLGPISGRMNSWNDGRNALAQFLKDLKKLMGVLIVDRLPDGDIELFEVVLPDVNRRVDEVMSEIEQTKEEDVAYAALVEVGLTGDSLALKLKEFYDSSTLRPVADVLHAGDIILGSLIKVFSTLEPVKEFKETLEHRLKTGGDRKVIESLDLTGREQWWHK